MTKNLWILASILVAAAGLAGCMQSATATEVMILDNRFSIEEVMISVGDTVEWTNNGAIAHTVTEENSRFNSGNMDSGDTFRYKFTTAGAYDYMCQYHPDMWAEIIVS